MDRDDLVRLSKEELVEAYLTLQALLQRKRRPRPIDFHGSVTLMEQRVSF